VGSEVGRPGGPWASSEVASADATSEAPNAWDIAVDPLQAPNALARGMDGAFAMIAAGPAGSLMPVPEMYMQKLVVPSVAADVIDLDALICDNLRAVATALGRKPSDLTVVVLDRPRHERLIEEVRQCGARVKLIGDGDVSAALAVPSEDDDIDVCVGIGGSTEGILTAAALRCIGGEIQARFWPTSRIQVDLVQAAGILDLETRLTARDMAGDGVLVAGTAITRGRFLREVTVHRYGARTHSLVLCTRCGSIQKIEAVHLADPGVTPVPLGAE
jgi:fructose-1,6-bisphosphatase II